MCFRNSIICPAKTETSAYKFVQQFIETGNFKINPQKRFEKS